MTVRCIHVLVEFNMSKRPNLQSLFLSVMAHTVIVCSEDNVVGLETLKPYPHINPINHLK